jgi:hypothetical protein
VHEQVRARCLLQRRAERLDELVGQVPDESDGVGERVRPAVRGDGAAGRRVEGCEQCVLDEDPGSRERVQQARLAGVGVADDRDTRDVVATALAPLGLADLAHRLDVAAQLGHAVADAPPVQLDLRLTGATATDPDAAGGPAADLPRQGLAPSAQAREQVRQLGELDLRLAVPRAGVLREDVEDQGGPVDHLDLELVLELAQLAGRELAVADHGVRVGGAHGVAELGDLARADEGGGIGPAAALDQSVEHLRAGGLGEAGQLGQRRLRLFGAALGPDTDEDDALEAQLPVLDLGDVGELRGETPDAAQ